MEKINKQVNICLTASELRYIQAQAQEQDKSVAKFVRDSIIAKYDLTSDLNNSIENKGDNTYLSVLKDTSDYISYCNNVYSKQALANYIRCLTNIIIDLKDNFFCWNDEKLEEVIKQNTGKL